MSSLRASLVAVGLLVAAPATPALTPSCGCGEAPPAGPGSNTTLVIGPGEYPGIRDGSFILHVPQGYGVDTAVPLVIALHGWTSSASGMMSGSKLDVSADAMGFVAAFPDGVDATAKYWPPVRRIDGAFGDRNLVCSCPRPEELAAT